MPPGLIMMALGPFRFGMLDGDYQTLTRNAAYRWGELKPIGAEPILQFMGPESAEIIIEGVIYPHFKGSIHQFVRMRELAGTGQAMMLVDGLGRVWRRWAIINAEERSSHFMSDGAPRKIHFTIDLKSTSQKHHNRLNLPSLDQLIKQAGGL